MTDDSMTVLIIDDEPQIRRVLRNAVTSEAVLPASDRDAPKDTSRGTSTIRVIEAETGQQGIDLAAAEAPALIVLDLGLPDMNGLDVCREIRAWSAAPIIVLSARHTDTEKAALLDAGADDYITKPFSTVEFLARVRTQLRRARAAPGRLGAAPTIFSFGEFVVDQQRRRLDRGGDLVHLTPTEWALLRTFVAHPGQTLTHRQIFQAVWGNSEGDAQQYLRVYVGHLRRKLEVDPMRPKFIQTEPGVGYRFEPGGDTAS